ncbi:uncharacterized protein J3D65DRAFT_616472 [Phyllosticta citribraziliensis]|uniref:protein disulfide-isomerase n=1 Tax=Phyllosticta citribraziliensis TaxID=989973 RepID=A0ABR1LZZ2_9PEZI
MVQLKAFAAAAAALCFSSPVLAETMYTKGSPVLQVDHKNYEKLIAKSNHTSIVEFYAPWCGHCRNLKPAYEKAAKNLAGLAQVAAINCDDEENKPLCGSMGVQGFPTLKLVRPGKKRPVVEDYQGARSAKAIVDAVVEKIPNHVKKVGDKDLDDFLKEGNDTAKAILFTEKGTTSALLRALAIDFLGSVQFAQIRNKEKKAVETFGVEKFPTLVLLPGGDKASLVYGGELKKDPMVEFVSQVAAPNPKAGDAKGDSKKKDSKAKDKKKETKDKADSKKEEKESEDKKPAPETEAQKPMEVKEEKPLIILIDADGFLTGACLTSQSHNCILTFVPTKTGEEATGDAKMALDGLTDVLKKHQRGGHRTFAAFQVPDNIEASAKLRKELGLKADAVEIVVTNAKKGWWKHYTKDDFSAKNLEDWIDAVKMGEGKKEKLPEGVVVQGIKLGDKPTVKKSSSHEGVVKEKPEEEDQDHDEL